jgi:valyl-tRNA synthetase
MLAQEGTDRHHLGRQAFIERVWKLEGGVRRRRSSTSSRSLGCSCDWSRERFTMDEGLSRAVREVFVRLYEDGLIYKGDYIINWCPRCQTALADLEVEHEPTRGHLYYIKYPIGRPGRFYRGHHPARDPAGRHRSGGEPRRSPLSGLSWGHLAPAGPGAENPLITDPHVAPEFGTGALKVTPAHDFHDFEIAQRWHLPAIKALDEAGPHDRGRGQISGPGPLRLPGKNFKRPEA